MKILLIAPHFPELNTPLELEQLGAGHQVVALTGNVTHERLTRATTGSRFDALHIASHCAKNQIALSDGEILTWDQLGQIGRKVRANLVFLNACESAFVAQALVDCGIPVVIAWTIPVLDENGVRTASFFYDELNHNDNDLNRAYRKVNPKDGTFLFLAGEGHIENVIQPLISRLDQLTQQIASMMTVLLRQRLALVVLAGIILAALLAGASFLFWPQANTQARGVPLGAVDAVGQSTDPLRLTPEPEPPTPTEPPTETVGEPVEPPATDTPGIDTPAPTVVEPVETDTSVPATDTPVISTPSDTPASPPRETSKPRRTATDTPTRAPTWTKTPEQPLAVTTGGPLGAATPLPGCQASGGQPKKCNTPSAPVASATSANSSGNDLPGTNVPPTNSTLTPVASTTSTSSQQPTASSTPAPGPINAPSFDPNIFTPWPSLTPSITPSPSITPKGTPTPLGEPPDAPVLAPCFTPVQKE